MITNQGYWLLIVKDELSDRFTTRKKAFNNSFHRQGKVYMLR